MNNTLVALAFVFLSVSVSTITLADEASAKQWSVIDNVQIARLPSFIDWDWSENDFYVSPDRHLIAFNVLASDIESDEVSSHLRVYSVSALQEYANDGSKPEPVFKKIVSGRLSIPSLSNFAWTPDSSALLFMSAETGSPAPHVWRVGRHEDKPVKKGTPATSYDFQVVGEDLIAVFEALPEFEPGSDGRPAHSPVTVTGRLLPEIILKWDLRGAIRPSRITLINWRIGKKVATIDAVVNPRVVLGVDRDMLSISPSSRRIAFAEMASVKRRGQCWTENPLALPPAEQAFPAREHAQIAFYDLRSKKVSRPFGGPVGLLSGDYGTSQVLWSPDGDTAIAPYTYTADDKCDSSSHAKSPGAYSYTFSRKEIATLFKYERASHGKLAYAPEKVAWAGGGESYEVQLRGLESNGDADKPKQVFLQFRKGIWEVIDVPQALDGLRKAADPGPSALEIRQGYDAPPAIYAVSPNGSSRILIDLAAHARNRKLSFTELITWTDSRGYEWQGLFSLPDTSSTEKRFPLIVQTHGFEINKFFTEGPTTSMFPGRAALARGFAVLTIKENYKAIFDEPANEGRNVLDGYRSAIAYLNKRRLIDLGRIGAIGWSRTSYHVKYALTHTSGLFSAAVVGDGVDFGYSMLMRTVDYDGGELSHRIYAIYGSDPWSAPENWIEEAPGFKADRVNAPVRIEANSGANGIFSEWEFYAGLRLLGKPVDLIFYPHGAHSLVLPSERMTSTQGSIDWLDFWINGVEDEDPAKADQYARWRKMRDEQCERLKDQDNTPWYCRH